MNTITIEVAGRESANRRVKAAMAGTRQGEFLTFENVDLLHRVLNPRRWALLRQLQARGPMGLRALARAMETDAGNLQRDVKQLKAFGLIIDTDAGLAVPYDEIRLEMVLSKAA